MSRLQTHAQVRVVAGTEIPAGARSAPFVLHSATAGLGELRKVKGQLSIGISGAAAEISVLSSLPKCCFWPRLVQFAPDCHAQNVRLCRLHPPPDSVVVLQAVRRIEAGEPLRLWLGEDLLVSALIPPYLSPVNIKGGKSYVCDKCGLAFEVPNELKLHLALNCGSCPLDTIWSRLATSSAPASETEATFSHAKALPARGALQPHFTLPLDFSNRVIRAPFFVPPLGGGQRFVIRQDPDSTSTTPSAPPPPRRSSNEASDRLALAQHRVLAEQHAHLESLVSNMGKGKNGHVCLYCGKLYSRKYGLKIHIRTHTGYKPLACKICHRPFGDPSNLNKHVRLHSDGSTPYKCDVCGKVLVRRRDLDRHLQSRHADLIRDSIRSS